MKSKFYLISHDEPKVYYRGYEDNGEYISEKVTSDISEAKEFNTYESAWDYLS